MLLCVPPTKMGQLFNWHTQISTSLALRLAKLLKHGANNTKSLSLILAYGSLT